MSENDPKIDSFAALFEQQGRSGRRTRDLRVGERLDVTVVQVTKDAVFVDLDEKAQAYLDAEELRGPDGVVAAKVGDRITAHVLEVNHRSGVVRLGKTMGKAGNLASLEVAREHGIAIEGKVTGINKGGVEVEIDGVRAFCPASQLEARFVQDLSTYLGRSLKFRVTELRDHGRSVVLSRRALLEAEAREAQERLLQTLAVGTTVRGTVTGVREFGAFVDLGGIEGLVPASELSYNSHARPGEVVSVGDVVEVQVKDIRPGEPQAKITLSLKALATDPWQALDVVAPVGRVVAGTVTRLADFGAFVQLAAGVEGLLHISELGARLEHPSQVLAVGQGVMVVVRAVDAAARKISLIPAPDNAVAGSAASGPVLAKGAVVQGTVERIEPYGIFIQVEGTKGRAGRGLIPSAELGTPRGVDLRKTFPEGTKVTAKVLETGEGRLRLSIQAVRQDQERADYEGYREAARTPGRMGTLGDLLKHKKKS